jgi:transcription initiation factor TFIIA large subunit
MMALPTAPMPFSTQPGAGYAALPHPAAASAFPLGVPPLAAPPMPAPAAGFPAVAAAVAAERKRQLDVMAAAQGQPPAKQAATGPAPPPGAIPQRDGPADEAEPAVGPAAATGDDGGAGTSAAAAAADGEEALGAGDDDDDEALGEDDDLADVDAEEVDEGDVRNVVTGVFDKVHRAKGRWKVFAKHCVATINGRDYLLKKVTGEMQFQ